MSEAPKTDRRQRIMQVAEQLFASRRFHEVTLDEIVRIARVGKGTIYTYFRDKDDLFFQVVTDGFDELCELLEAAPDADSFEKQLLGVCDAISDFFGRRRQLFRVIQDQDARLSVSSVTLRSRWMSKRKRLAAALAGILDRGRREGLLRADMSAEVLAVMLLGLLRTRGQHLHEKGVNLDSETLVSFFMHGAGANRESKRATRIADEVKP